MEKNEKVYMANQLNCMLPPSAVKVMNYVLSWQSQGDVKYYEKQFGSISGKQITLPIEHKPNRDFLAYHRDHVFVYIRLAKRFYLKPFKVVVEQL